MKRLSSLATPWWIGGALLAGCGVIFARVISPAMGPNLQPYCEAAGKLLALGGLAVIATGVSRRVNRNPVS